MAFILEKGLLITSALTLKYSGKDDLYTSVGLHVAHGLTLKYSGKDELYVVKGITYYFWLDLEIFRAR